MYVMLRASWVAEILALVKTCRYLAAKEEFDLLQTALYSEAYAGAESADAGVITQLRADLVTYAAAIEQLLEREEETQHVLKTGSLESDADKHGEWILGSTLFGSNPTPTLSLYQAALLTPLTCCK